MKKQLFLICSTFLMMAVLITGCRKEEPETVTVTIPDTVVDEASSEKTPTIEPEITEPLPEEPADEPAPENNLYPYWSDLYDYHSDQPDLAADGEIKNLTIQPGDTPDSLNITWFSKSSSRGKVTFQADGLFHNLSAKATTEPSISVPGYYRNSAVIEGLESNTLYQYTVKNGGTESPVYRYETKDLYSTDFTFTIAGDPEIGLGDEEVLAGHRSIWRVVLNRMKEQIPDSSFLITTGDQIANPASSVHYDSFLDNSVLYSTPLVPLVGNHDVGTGFFGDHFSLPNMNAIGTTDGRDGDYWFVRGNALFMVLNTSNPSPDEIHEDFIAQAIQENPDAKWRIVLSHYSPITMIERNQDNREDIRYVFPYIGETFDIDLFIGGHDHLYTRGYFLDMDSDPIEGQTVEYEFHNPEYPMYTIFNGATNALFRDPSENYPWAAVCVQNHVPQLAQVHVTENSLNVKVHDADTWNVIDDFTIYKD